MGACVSESVVWVEGEKPSAEHDPSFQSQSILNLLICSFKRDMDRYYKRGRVMGKGTFGTVLEATCRRTGKELAVKTIAKKFFGEYLESHFLHRIQHEVDIYMHMGNSLNVAHLYDVFEDDDRVDLVMERCTGGELWQRIRQGQYNELGVNLTTMHSVIHLPIHGATNHPS
jgi:calcium-dependent protein kinase